MQGGTLEEIANSDSPKLFLTRLRSAFPLAAAYIALVIMVVRYYRTRLEGFHFFGPLGLTAAYGLVGLSSLAYSPDASISLYWLFAYLSVPIVLWGVTLGPDALERINLLISANWLIAVVSMLVLLVLAFSFLNLGGQLLHPQELLECRYRPTLPGQSWYLLTDGGLRPTGVGRIAAIAAIVALSYMWSGRFRYLWGFLLVAGFLILLTSGARTSFVGFAGAAIFIVLLHGRTKGLIALGVLAAALVLVVAFTHIDNNFANNCLDSSYTAGTSLLREELQQVNQPQEKQHTETNHPADTLEFPTPTQDRFSASAVESPIPLSTPSPFSTPAGENPIPLSTPSPFSTPAAESPIPLSTPSPFSTPVFEILERTGSSAVKSELATPSEQTTDRNSFAIPGVGEFDTLIFKLSGRTAVWEQAFRSFKDSPVLGFGFQGDRLVLGTHMHNSYLHAVFQTGIIGFIPFIAALIVTAFLLARAVYRISWLPKMHQHLVIQTGAMLVFFSVRSIPESSGAFFGIDWLLLAPLLLYLQLVNNRYVDGHPEAALAREESAL